MNTAYLSAGLSVLGMAANARSVRDTNETNIQLMRERNAAQAAANAAAWQREVAYNNPSAQVSRIRAAGLNPNLMYNSTPQNTVNMVAPDVQAANAQAVQYDTSGATSSLLSAAGIDKTMAETSQSIAVTEGIDLDNKLKSATLGQNIELANINVKQGVKGLEYTDSQIAMFSQTMSKLDADIGLIKEQTKSVSQSRFVEMVRLGFESREVDAKVKNLMAQTGLTKKQIEKMVIEMPYIETLKDYETNEVYWRSYGFMYNTKQSKLDFEINTDYEESMKKIGMFRSLVDVVGTIVGGLIGRKSQTKR